MGEGLTPPLAQPRGTSEAAHKKTGPAEKTGENIKRSQRTRGDQRRAAQQQGTQNAHQHAGPLSVHPQSAQKFLQRRA